MTAQVWKFPVRMEETFVLEMPSGSEILSLQIQHGEPQMWALVDTMLPTTPRMFRMVGTGHPLVDSGDVEHVGTFQVQGGTFVFHLFEYPDR